VIDFLFGMAVGTFMTMGVIGVIIGAALHWIRSAVARSL
jgi:hypothetical protein